MGKHTAPQPLDHCTDCGAVLTRMFDLNEGDQYDNVLILHIGRGGYGMFTDNCDGDYPTIYLCHDCAHRLCDNNPWLKNIIKPELSHAHTQEFWENNNGHQGWDKEMQ